VRGYVTTPSRLAPRPRRSSGLPRLINAKVRGLAARQRDTRRLVTLVHPSVAPFVHAHRRAKVSDQLPCALLARLERLKAGDSILIGGAMANTFLARAEPSSAPRCKSRLVSPVRLREPCGHGPRAR
jgi:3-phosphoglycerate kinase